VCFPRRLAAIIALLLAASIAIGDACAAWAAGAESPGSQRDAASPTSNAPDLDRLLKLPDTDYGFEKKGGATRSEWRARFLEARSSLEAAQAALAKAENGLAAAGSESEAWTFTPPGLPAGTNTEPTDGSQLRQEVKKDRAEVERAQARLRELDVQANLAGVPEDWRGPRTEPSTKNETVAPGTGTK
jgi:multidrug efflux pump subunit AcrA (membrane-fusion protein)